MTSLDDDSTATDPAAAADTTPAGHTGEDDPPRPLWARVAVYGFGATVGGCALTASGVDLYGLVQVLGFATVTCVALPVGLDAGASTTGVLWITAPPGSDERARWRNATLGLVGASAALNGVSVLAAPHWLMNALRKVADVSLLPAAAAVGIAVAIAFAFPLVAAWMVHAILRVRDAAARHRATRPARRPIVRDLCAATAEWAHDRAAARRARRAAEDSTADSNDAPEPLEPGGVVPEPVGVVPTATPTPVEAPPEPAPTTRPLAPHRRRPAPSPSTAALQRPRRTPTRPPTPPTAPPPAHGADGPPAQTGKKKADARAFAEWSWRRGDDPLLPEVNDHVRSDSLVKRTEFEGWQAEYDADPNTPRRKRPGAALSAVQ